MVEEQNQQINTNNLRLKPMYVNPQLDVVKGLFGGCSEEEIAELKKRRSLEDWLIDTK